MIRMLATFHSNHVCAQIGEQASAERTGEYMSEIKTRIPASGAGILIEASVDIRIT